MFNKIEFAHDLVEPILTNKKTITYRLGTKYFDNLEAGQVIDAFDAQTQTPFATLKILDVYTSKLSDIPLDQPGHNDYGSYEEFVQNMQHYYENEEVSANSVITTVKFALLHTY